MNISNVLYHARLAGASSLNRESLLPKKIHPKVVGLKLTEHCNSRCITCNYWRTADKYKNLISTERAVSLLREFIGLDIRTLWLSGGEALLRKDLFHILGHFGNGEFHRITLATNGQLLARLKDQINGSPITNITVSLDGIGERNDRIRGIKGYYDNVINSLPLIKKKLKIVSTLTKDLLPDLDTLISYCEQNGYDFDFNILEHKLPYFDSEEVKKTVESLVIPKEDMPKLFEILALHSTPEFLLEEFKMYTEKARFSFNHCMFGYMQLNIDSKGDVQPGCYLFEPAGNILQSDLQSIIENKAYMEVAKEMYHLHCQVCTCGYGVSSSYKNPLRSAVYALKRLKQPQPARQHVRLGKFDAE